MDKWAVATKRQERWALYEDAAGVMKGECSRRSESRFTTPFFLNPTSLATDLKPFVRLPKERPAQGGAGLMLNKAEVRSTKRGTRSWCSSRRCSCASHRCCRHSESAWCQWIRPGPRSVSSESSSTKPRNNYYAGDVLVGFAMQCIRADVPVGTIQMETPALLGHSR